MRTLVNIKSKRGMAETEKEKKATCRALRHFQLQFQLFIIITFELNKLHLVRDSSDLFLIESELSGKKVDEADPGWSSGKFKFKKF